jgi:hypothetical protein
MLRAVRFPDRHGGIGLERILLIFPKSKGFGFRPRGLFGEFEDF